MLAQLEFLALLVWTRVSDYDVHACGNGVGPRKVLVIFIVWRALVWSASTLCLGKPRACAELSQA